MNTFIRTEKHKKRKKERYKNSNMHAASTVPTNDYVSLSFCLQNVAK